MKHIIAFGGYIFNNGKLIGIWLFGAKRGIINNAEEIILEGW